MQNDQADHLGGRQIAQVSIEFNQGLLNKRNASVQPRQGVENFAVKYKDAVHRSTVPECQLQGSVIFQAQIASEPNQTGCERTLHDNR
jgi:hypothetical protein